MSRKFYFASPNDSSTSLSSTSSDLPFPTALPRSDFLIPDFNPSTYLTSLGHRHQTLEDLRSELRARSQFLNQELLDLVNAHYADFLGLGISLKGGDEKIEELRMGVLGFQRELEAAQKDIANKEEEVRLWLEERARATKEIVLGKVLLAIDERVRRLEKRLMLSSAEIGPKEEAFDSVEGLEASESSEDEDEEGTEDTVTDTLEIAIAKLDRRIRDYKLIEQLSHQAGKTHPFILAYEARSTKIYQTLISDVQAILKQVKKDEPRDSAKVMTVAIMYRELKANRDVPSQLLNAR